jgi:hypothetical protein
VDYGIPEYTLFTFDSPALATRYAFDAALDAAAFARGFTAFNAPALLPNARYLYSIRPDPQRGFTVVSVPLFRATVHGKLLGGEETANVLHLLDLGAPGYARDAAGALAVGTAVRDAWNAFLTGAGGHPAGAGFYSSSVTWDEVRVAPITVTSPAPIVSGKPKPVHFDTPTQYVPWGSVKSGTGGTSLPYEVACALSLGTGVRGRSSRGRTYLGPISAGTIAATPNEGLFDPAVTLAIAQGWWANVAVALAATPGLQLVVLSVKNATVLAVSNVRVGQVPDSQRRRRRSLPEAYQLAGGAL